MPLSRRDRRPLHVVIATLLLLSLAPLLVMIINRDPSLAPFSDPGAIQGGRLLQMMHPRDRQLPWKQSHVDTALIQRDESPQQPQPSNEIQSLDDQPKLPSTKSNNPAPVLKDTPGDFEPKQRAPERRGVGENGVPVTLMTSERALYEQSYKDYGFNMVVSDRISLDRAVPDIRDPQCRYWHYPEKLPNTSVVVVFHNEGWSTLIRTLRSVINMTPSHLLHEIVMVDDYSDKEHLKRQLDDYIVRPEFEGKVRLFRNSQRDGLIRSRISGARRCKGEVVTFLDAHCECNVNWLPPLLAEIAVSSSPVMAGGLFAIDRAYFFELGGYDPGLQIWGGENFEISFKIWMCGGKLKFVPCSRVGHIYRKGVPYSYPDLGTGVSVVQTNYMRVAEVWLDEYIDFFYANQPELRGKPFGNITDQVRFRRQHCHKSFDWFMKEVAFDTLEKFPPPPVNKLWGEIRGLYSDMCLDTMGRDGSNGLLGASHCHGLGGNQLFRLNVAGELVVHKYCIIPMMGQVLIKECGTVGDTTVWEFDEGTGQLRVKTTSDCLQLDIGSFQVTVQLCDINLSSQKFQIAPPTPR
ncbi:N-acetylgalactosaminyltransferase 7-like isoform X2 [Asterias rubens]|uniref:N-acetylgalactosaminyltransferase 7-like isoform X2 n=1 Tax=Asterias rubens TaxID=7604 RepID=UPI0014553D16|nr:N-acetylgalactosaminyltransferase 7-like isoform X2 [Asterias rubens]